MSQSGIGRLLGMTIAPKEKELTSYANQPMSLTSPAYSLIFVGGIKLPQQLGEKVAEKVSIEPLEYIAIFWEPKVP